ncbi:MAG: hypothetical protein ABL953_11080 [Ilumatobacteraceae bacterium]
MLNQLRGKRQLHGLGFSLCLLCSACGSDISRDGRVESETTTAVTTTSTVPPTTSTSSTTTTIAFSRDRPIGEQVAGNRVIMIGDSVLASSAERHHGEMCDAVVPLGWQVEVDAEQTRYIEFATLVLDQRLEAGWDVALIILGNNYKGDIAFYTSELTTILQRLSPRPIVLLTVSEPGFTGRVDEVNAALRAAARSFENVVLIDWSAATAENPSFLNDEVHPSIRGRAAFVALVAAALGPAPLQPGACLETEFDYDGRRPLPATTEPPPATDTTTP